MRLYHFTCIECIEGILTEGIHPGLIPFENGSKYGAVSLTTDRSPVGHGLTTGEVVTGEVLRRLAENQPNYDGRDPLTLPDRRKFRLALDIDYKDELLLSWKQYRKSIKGTSYWERAMAMSGYLPLGQTSYSDSEFKRLLSGFGSNAKPSKAPTWYFYFGLIPTSAITLVEERTVGGAYIPISNIQLPPLSLVT